MAIGLFKGIHPQCARWLTTSLLAGVLAVSNGFAEEIPSPAAVCDLQPTGPISGTLFICGGGTLPNTLIDRFFELAGGPAARIVMHTSDATRAHPQPLRSSAARPSLGFRVDGRFSRPSHPEPSSGRHQYLRGG